MTSFISYDICEEKWKMVLEIIFEIYGCNIKDLYNWQKKMFKFQLLHVTTFILTWPFFSIPWSYYEEIISRYEKGGQPV